MDLESLSKALGMHPQIVALLEKRGISSVEEAKRFLYPQLEDMHPASGIANIDKAAARIQEAIDKKEKILIFGDYDCDGISATTIMTLFLKGRGAEVYYNIPRRQDGYGLSETAVEQVVEKYLPDLMITVDCGITSVVEVEYAQDLGVDVIVTDHHEPQDELPDCIVVNPKLGNDEALRNLCGAGVAMKLVEALSTKAEADSYLDLAALATVADVVPLLGENRIIVHYGLKALKESKRKGLRALIRSCELEDVTAMDVGFRIAPRINALGRLNDEADVVELFLTDDDFVVRELVEKVGAANTARQTLTKQLAQEAYLKLRDYDLTGNRVIVLWDDKWETGVLGLVAARLAQEFYRPVVLLSNVGDCFKGSARSIPGVNLFASLQAVENRLLGFGGHMGAAGMSVRRENLKVFAEELNEYLAKTYDEDVFVPKKQADIRFDKNAMQTRFFEDLARLEPFGEGNPSPKFVVSSADCRLTRINETEHVKCKMNADVDLVYFGGYGHLAALKTGATFDYYCDAAKKVFQNRAYIQLSVNDLATAGCESLRECAPAFGRYVKDILNPPATVGTRMSTLEKEIKDLKGIYGTLFVAFSVKSAQDFLKELTIAGKKSALKRIAVGKTEANPLHTLLVTPTDCDGWQYYSSIVFLDAPLSMGYLAAVGEKAPNPELVLIRRYAYTDKIKALHLEERDIEQTLRGIRRLDPMRYHNLDELCQALQANGYDIADAYAHYMILYELGVIAEGKGFRLQFREKAIELSASKVYKNLSRVRGMA